MSEIRPQVTDDELEQPMPAGGERVDDLGGRRTGHDVIKKGEQPPMKAADITPTPEPHS